MSKFYRQKFFLLVIFSLTFIFPKAALAYSGRVIAMGEAFTGLANDPSAVWWNPAGLPQIKNSQIIYTRLLGDRDVDYFGPDDFAAVSIPFGDKKEGALGFAVYSDQQLTTISYQNNAYSGYLINRLGLISYSQILYEDFSVGFSVKFAQRMKYFKLNGQNISSEAQVSAYDFGIHWKVARDIYLGLLVQNANAPEYTIFEKKEPLFANIRPGIVWQLQPNAKVVLDIDDIFGETDGQNPNIAMNVSVGAEFKFYNQGCLRIGVIRMNSATPSERMGTIGFGIGEGNYSVDFAAAYPVSKDSSEKRLFTFLSVSYTF
jgi:hypothetical protein